MINLFAEPRAAALECKSSKVPLLANGEDVKVPSNGKVISKTNEAYQVVALCDRRCNVLAPFIAAPGNQNESPMLVPTLNVLTAFASFDGVYDSKTNRKAIFNRRPIPNIPENRRRRTKTRRGRKRLAVGWFDAGLWSIWPQSPSCAGEFATRHCAVPEYPRNAQEDPQYSSSFSGLDKH